MPGDHGIRYERDYDDGSDFAMDKIEWEEELHPRDPAGKFAKAGSVLPVLHQTLTEHGFKQHPESPHAIYQHPSGHQVAFGKGEGGSAHKDWLNKVAWKLYKDYKAHPDKIQFKTGTKGELTAALINEFLFAEKASESGEKPGGTQVVAPPDVEKVAAPSDGKPYHSLALGQLAVSLGTYEVEIPETGELVNAELIVGAETDDWVLDSPYYQKKGSGQASLNAAFAGTPPITPPEVPPASEPPIAVKSLKKVGEKLGSNPGGVYEDPATGKRYYVKQTQSPDHARNENLAAALYALAGVGTLQYRKASDDDTAVVTEMQDLSANNLGKLASAQRKAAQRAFAVHAWLANWDTVGLDGDNVGADQDGKVLSLDLGGSLLYRAQGSPKGNAFGDDPTEWNTLRDPSKNPQAASLFMDMTDEQLKKSAALLDKIDLKAVDKAVKESGLPSKIADDLYLKLVQRRLAIQAAAASLSGSSSPQSQPSSPQTPQFVPPFATKPNPGAVILKLSIAASKPTSAQRAAIKSYTDGGYTEINAALRFGFTSGSHPQAKHIAAITSWLNEASLPEETIVNRRVSGDYAFFLKKNAAVGAEFADYGFSSTSVNPGTWSGDVTMVVRLPKGAKAASVMDVSVNKGEYEVLVQRGTKYRVSHYNPETSTLYCEIDQSAAGA